MSLDLRAGKRARLLAILLATTSLHPLCANAQDNSAAVTLPVIDVATPLTLLYQQPTGQTETTVPRENVLTNTKAFSTWEALRDSPGVTLKQGNGARDVGISIRGSNARNGFGIRNIAIYEDGFPVTQPDGLSRGDLIDLHAYSGIDVIRGPSSALFGNYATGGAVNFRLRRGAEINGLDVGTEGGSFGYLNN
jgi:iron complex outermembrane receptor protein